MTEYTSLDISKRLYDVKFHNERSAPDPDAYWITIGGRGHLICVRDLVYDDIFAYRADTLLSWLLSHGDSIEITPDLDGFNVTYWVKHDDYNGINIFLCDALGEVILAVMAKEAEHD